MKLKDIASKYSFDVEDFWSFLQYHSSVTVVGAINPSISDKDVALSIKLYKEELERRKSGVTREDIQKAAEEKKRKEAEAFKQASQEMILSTCQSIDGYKAVKQFGLVFGEVVFKSGFIKRLNAAMENIDAALTFGDQEMRGTTAMIENARTYAKDKMVEKAVKLGANAVIGIDAESTSGGDLMHITIYGTAVRIEPIE